MQLTYKNVVCKSYTVMFKNQDKECKKKVKQSLEMESENVQIARTNMYRCEGRLRFQHSHHF